MSVLRPADTLAVPDHNMGNGPKQVLAEILDGLDKETVLLEARREIRARLRLA